MSSEDRKLRVVFFAPSVGNAQGPLIYWLTRELAREVDLTLLVPEAYQGGPGDPPLLRFPMGTGKARKLLRMGNPIAHWRLWRRMASAAPDLVHVFNGDGYPWSLGLGGYCRARGIPILLSVHDPEPHPGSLAAWMNARLGRATLAAATAVHVFNERFTPIIRAQGIAPARILVTPHGNMAAQYLRHARAGVPRERLVLLFGRLEAYKGIEILAEAAEFLPPDIRVAIAGPGELPAILKKRILRSPERFELHDRFLADEDVARLFQRAAVLALPYLQVTQSSLPLIAAEFGVPVVASALGAFLDDVPEVGGRLVPPKDPWALAEAIVASLGSTPRVPADKSLSRIAGDYAAMYRQTLRLVTRPAVMPSSHL